MPLIKLIFSFVLLLSPAVRCRAADIFNDSTETKTGSFELTFSERSPVSALTEEVRRFGWQLEAIRKTYPDPDYEISKESFDVYVPDSYKAGEKWGLLVWVSPGNRAEVMGQWKKVLAKSKLIWIGARNSGNDRGPQCRTGMAVDAAFNMQKKYSIDPARVYIAGVSGGGRVSSLLGVAYSDVFTGGIYMVGCDFYAHLPVPDEPGKVYQKLYSAPQGKLLIDARKKSRHVFLTGEHDQNRTQTKVVYEQGFKRAGFEHILYIEVEGMKHEPPPAEWFEKAIAFLDNPVVPEDPKADEALAAKADAELKAAMTLLETDQLGAYEAFERIARKYARTEAGRKAAAEHDKLKGKVEDAQAADKILRVAKLYAENRMYSMARAKLKQLLSDYPKAPAAKDAKELLQTIGEND